MVESLIQIGRNNPELLAGADLELPKMRLVQGRLQDIYFVHIFACFESDIRDYWRAVGRSGQPHATSLLNSVAGKRGIPQDIVDAIHDIREFRNSLVHGSRDFARPYTVDEASGPMNAFIARLPLEW
jgi:hypothetical protein